MVRPTAALAVRSGPREARRLALALSVILCMTLLPSDDGGASPVALLVQHGPTEAAEQEGAVDLDLAAEETLVRAVVDHGRASRRRLTKRRLPPASMPLLAGLAPRRPPAPRDAQVVISTGMLRSVGIGLVLPWMAAAGCLLAPFAYSQVAVQRWNVLAFGACWLMAIWTLGAAARSQVIVLDDGTVHVQGILRYGCINLADVTAVSVDPPPCRCSSGRCVPRGEPPIVTLHTSAAAVRLRTGWWRSEEQLFNSIRSELYRRRPTVDVDALRVRS
jgi:hypothetical protein